MSYSRNSGSVTGPHNTGGLIGHNDGGTVEKSYNTGGITGGDNTGGLVGYSDGGTVEKSFNTGSISGADNIGGLVGYNDGGEVTNSYNTGDVSGSFRVGGIAGYYPGGGVVLYCYNTGPVSGYHYTGGVIGHYSSPGYGRVVAFNRSLSYTLSGDIVVTRVFCGTGFFSGNKARDDMVVTDGGIIRTVLYNTYGNDGEGIPVGTALSQVFSGWDRGIWDIPHGSLVVNGALPKLRRMPLGTQAPVLP